MSGFLHVSRAFMPAPIFVHTLAGGERLQVHAGAEDLLARAREDHGADVVVLFGPLERVHQTLADLGVERVARIGTV